MMKGGHAGVPRSYENLIAKLAIRSTILWPNFIFSSHCMHDAFREQNMHNIIDTVLLLGWLSSTCHRWYSEYGSF